MPRRSIISWSANYRKASEKHLSTTYQWLKQYCRSTKQKQKTKTENIGHPVIRNKTVRDLLDRSCEGIDTIITDSLHTRYWTSIPRPRQSRCWIQVIMPTAQAEQNGIQTGRFVNLNTQDRISLIWSVLHFELYRTIWSMLSTTIPSHLCCDVRWSDHGTGDTR